MEKELKEAQVTSQPILRFENLGKDYGDFTAVDSVSLEVKKGEIFGYLGPNGAGKTTSIRMLMGILVPSSGRITVDGLDTHADRVAVKHRLGYLPDNPFFYDYLKGREILEFVGEMHGLNRSEACKRSSSLLEEFGLSEASEEFAVNYSTGMKKKLGLAMALIHQPPLLVLDEPTNGLDPRATREVEQRLVKYAENGGAIFLSTHLLHIAERICHKVGIIHNGKLAAVDRFEVLRERIKAGGSLEDVFLKLTESQGPGGIPS